MKISVCCAMAVLGCALAASGVNADIFSMPSGQTSLSLVPVGNPGNPLDTGTGGEQYGAVAYDYAIGKHEVTIGQYVQFLNAVAATDTFALYHPSMTTNLNVAGISRLGSPGSYSYQPIGSPNRPITFVNWGSAARFTNWLTNGQPTGPQGPATTEDGSYVMNGAMSNAALMAVTRKPTAQYVIPTVDEWYKAAYFDPTPGAGGGDNYWRYAMQTDTTPDSAPPPGTATPNAALTGNFFREDHINNGYNGGYALTGVVPYSPTASYLTDVGAYTSTTNYWGTFDQTGNVFEMVERILSQNGRTAYGGSWGHDEVNLSAGIGLGVDPTEGREMTGFRVALVPEPSAIISLTFGGGLLLLCRRRKLATGFLLVCLVSRVDASPTLRTVAGNNSVRALSTDGSAAVGWTDTSSGPRSFHWTASTFQPLPPLSGDIDSMAYGISGDGMTVVGESGPDAARGAIRWTMGASAVELLPLPTHVKSTAYAISTDGSTVTGDSELVPVLWGAGTSAQGLIPASGIGLAASANGSVLAGGSLHEAFRWSESSGEEILASLPGGSYTEARGLSADGSIAAGFSETGGTFHYKHAVRWTSSGLQDLGLFSGGFETFGLGTNASGDAVVGYGRRTAGGYRAVLWTEALGMLDLNSYLPTQGISLSGKILDYAFAISPDGTAIGGMGHSLTGGGNFGWVVSGLDPVPEPATASLLLVGVGLLSRRRMIRAGLSSVR